MSSNRISQMGQSTMDVVKLLSVLGVFLVAGLSLWRSSSESAKADSAVEALYSWQSIVQAQNPKGGYENLDERALAADEATPGRHKIKSHFELKHPWSSDPKAVSIGPVKSGSSASRFYVQLSQIPLDACSKIVRKTYERLTVSRGFIGVPPTGSPIETRLDQALAVCWADGTGDDGKTMTLNFVSF